MSTPRSLCPPPPPARASSPPLPPPTPFLIFLPLFSSLPWCLFLLPRRKVRHCLCTCASLCLLFKSGGGDPGALPVYRGGWSGPFFAAQAYHGRPLQVREIGRRETEKRARDREATNGLRIFLFFLYCTRYLFVKILWSSSSSSSSSRF